jgi:hypothetical protein
MIKTTLRLDDKLFREAQHRRIDEGITFQELVERAVREYLKKPLVSDKDRKGARR